VSSLKSHGAEMVAGRVEQVEGEPLMFEAHHRRGDRDAALALDRHPIRAHPPPLAARLHLTRQLDAPPNSSNFSVNVVLPASGREIIAKVRGRKVSSVCRPALRPGIVTAQRFANSGERQGIRKKIHPRQAQPGLGPSPIKTKNYFNDFLSLHARQICRKAFRGVVAAVRI
jgi:hypothetical protein